MRVYIVTANWGHGGPGGVASDLYNRLTANGHECRFAYGRESIPPEVSSYRIGSKLDVYAHALAGRLFDKAGFASTGATKKLVEDIERFRPDILNIHNPLGYTMNVEVLLDYIRKSGIPTVWTLHDCWSFTGHCITGLCDRLAVGCGNCPRKREYPASMLLDRSAKNYQKKKRCFADIPNLSFVGPSQWICDLAKQSYLGEYDIHNIPNGIDLTVFQPTPSDVKTRYGLDGHAVLLAVASVWGTHKGIRYLFDLMKKAGDAYRLVIVGKVDKSIDPTNYENILFIERTTDREELAKWYSAADVFVNPTVGDNFPTVNLEALACGTPIVTFNTGGSGEMVGDCGEVVEQGNTEALLLGIERCVKRGIAPASCRRQAEKYDKGERYDEYIRYFHDRLNKQE